jgi:hypothetical protein
MLCIFLTCVFTICVPPWNIRYHRIGVNANMTHVAETLLGTDPPYEVQRWTAPLAADCFNDKMFISNVVWRWIRRQNNYLKGNRNSDSECDCGQFSNYSMKQPDYNGIPRRLASISVSGKFPLNTDTSN